MDDVAEWRKRMRTDLVARRIALTPAERETFTARINGHLLEILGEREPGVLGFYWPMRGEYDPRPLVDRLLARDWRAALPVVVAKDKALEYRAWTPETVMERGPLGIMAPREGAPVIPDAVLAPLVGYDAARYRLGNGGGYFDRTLAALDVPLAIGVGFALCRLDTIHPQPHDRPMDMIVTEDGVLR